MPPIGPASVAAQIKRAADAQRAVQEAAKAAARKPVPPAAPAQPAKGGA